MVAPNFSQVDKYKLAAYTLDGPTSVFQRINTAAVCFNANFQLHKSKECIVDIRTHVMAKTISLSDLLQRTSILQQNTCR